jgi:hypothetical protein
MRKSLAAAKYITTNEAEKMGINPEEILNICKDGQLISSRWYYDELTENGKYIYLDVTNELPNHLFERVRFVDDLCLKDILVLVKNNIDFIDPIVGNWCREIVEKGLTNIKPYESEYDSDGIEYLEFYRYLTLERDYREADSSEKKMIEGIDELSFHGVGFELQEDHNHHSTGTRINWSLGFIKINEIADTPIKINPEIPIHNMDGTRDVVGAYEPRLINVIRELFYELSWYGPPDDKDES